jgi:hypothetical protein
VKGGNEYTANRGNEHVAKGGNKHAAKGGNEQFIYTGQIAVVTIILAGTVDDCGF